MPNTLLYALSDAGFKVLGESRGYTQSHQIAVNVLDYSDGGKVEAELEKANIIVPKTDNLFLEILKLEEIIFIQVELD